MSFIYLARLTRKSARRVLFHVFNARGSREKQHRFDEAYVQKFKYLFLPKLEVRTISYGPSFFPSELWPKREARGP